MKASRVRTIATLFGGVMLTTTGLVQAQTWTKLFPSGTPPAPRDDSSGIYDGGSNSLVIFGGNSTGCTFSPSLNDTWLLTNADGLGSAAPQWIQLSPSGTFPGVRRGQSAVYDSNTDRMIIFGGDPVGCAVSKYNDTWLLLNVTAAHGTPSWVELEPVGALPPDALITRLSSTPCIIA